MTYQESATLHPETPDPPRPADSPADTQASPLRTVEDFNGYCQQVQGRLAEHAARRRYFLQAAHDRLTQLLYTARAVGDQSLYRELWQHRATARELLDALQRTGPGQAAPAPFRPNADLPPRANGNAGDRPPYSPGPPFAGQPFTNQPFAPQPRNTGPRPAARETPEPGNENFAGGNSAAFNEPRLPRRPVRPVADIETDAGRLREQLKEWTEQWPLLRENKDLNAPNCLRLRAVACHQRRLEEEAGDTEIAEVTELGKDVVALLDEADDQEYTVALDDDLNPAPTSFQWKELAERYEDMARAQEAFEWWQIHKVQLPNSDAQPLAEAIAAVQQRFNRLLFRVGARDPFQQTLFDELRTWAREAQCFLHSLRPKVPYVELSERAATLDPAWQGARSAIEHAEE